MIMRLLSMCSADHVRSNVRLDTLIVVTDIHFVIRATRFTRVIRLAGFYVRRLSC
jgi:hypothetical protein